ncbi:MAG: DNA topoisomerase VI subunit B [archaeon]
MTDNTQEFDSEDFFKRTYRESNVAEFFRRNLHMLGYAGPLRNLTTIVHEFVTNGLDACEEGNILPEIVVELEGVGEREFIVSVQDNGTGIPESFIPKLLGKMLSGTKFHRYIQSRGQQGIGSVGAIMFAHMTTGQPIKIVTSTGNGTIITAVMDIDIKKNEPVIYELLKAKGKWRGTKIVAHYKEVLYQKSEQGVLEYLRRTAMANPHAKITLKEPDGNVVAFERSAKKIPPKPTEMQPHPLGLSADDLRGLAANTDARKLSTFLSSALSRVSSAKVEEIAKLCPGVDFGIDPREITHHQAEAIVKSFSQIKFIAPTTDGLVPIGEERIEESLKTILKPNFYSVVTRAPSVYKGGIPFQVEVGIAYEGEAGRTVTIREDGSSKSARAAEIMRFTNRVPLLFDLGGCAITQAVKSVEWKRYHITDFDNSPITVVVNFISPHVPYTSAGKQALAEDDDIIAELRFALMDAGRKLKSHLAGIRREQMKQRRRDLFNKYIPEIAKSVSKLSRVPEGTLKEKLQKLVSAKLKKGDVGDEEEEACGVPQPNGKDSEENDGGGEE